MFDSVAAQPPDRPDHGDRTVRPPRPVWVDLARLYPLEVWPQRSNPAGWDLQDEVAGELSAWRRDTAGRWLAQVRFRIRRGDGSHGVWLTSWLPPAAVRPREDAPARPPG
ncbi:hypothetical protein IQ251_15705 [Saccharopolyspora sp. HNM0983]|uniref:Uncharacterized protein n=1 Tax=Saccharopolyspora montiporae TaxID=2781240 RepID=A0A929BD79_9PSEU|nr:hypothetical protein [Saccharopolyspora sp. HNM0983]MBE9375896.1 hypothetical protein [Saccharopolyspora sp. HNM0983]